MIRRAGLALVVIVVGLVTYPGAVLASLATRVTPAPQSPAVSSSDLPWLRVTHPADGLPFISDGRGNLVILHGAIPASLLEFGPGTAPVYPIDPAEYANGQCPPTSTVGRYPPLCELDVDEMSRFGFNSIRLPISWSVLEPQRGRFSETYLDRVAQIVDWARKRQMYVIIDMHQNAYSHYVGPGPNVDLSYDSGAPAWATFTDGFPSQVYAHQREVNPAVLEATTNFWFDRHGIQDEYLAALASIAKRFRDDPAVAGFSIYNEPLPGWNLSPGFEDLLLFPFYRRAIDAITGVHDGLPCWSGVFMPAACGYRDLDVDDTRHLIFLEAGLLRQVTDFPTHLSWPVSSYPNVVLSIHAYTHVFTLDSLVPQLFSRSTYPSGGYDQSYSLGEREARAMDAALFVAEFGNAAEDDNTLLSSQVAEQERHRLGFAFWPWKELGTSWGLVGPPTATQPLGCARASRERYLARVYPRSTADRNFTFRYDSFGGSFELHASGRPGDSATVVYVPPEVNGSVNVSGAAIGSVTDQLDGSRLVEAVPTGGPFAVYVTPAPLALMGC
ncbi:MAG TPA: cellulase family glycosylhydrolase [Candidatus Dormibacteraeota bacterium]|nr:cellulase family glycosylhydrolase [Candidatus Dormibacteraeota bacterium]